MDTHPYSRGVGAQSARHFLLLKIGVVTVAELLAGFGSKLGELATAVFVIDFLFDDPATFTVIVTVAEAPLAMLPRPQVIICDKQQAVQNGVLSAVIVNWLD